MYISHIDIHYKASAYLDDELFVEVESIETGAVRGTLRQTIRKADGTICVEAEVTWASVNKDGRPSRIPKEFIVEGLLPKKAE